MPENVSILALLIPESNYTLTGKACANLESLRPKLKFYLFPLTRTILKKGSTRKNLFQFSVKNFF